MRKESILIIGGIVLVFLFANISYGQSPYRFDVIGTSSATQAFNSESVSINNNGEISFIGKNNPGGGLVFTDFLPNHPKNVYPNFANNTQSLFSQHSQINDNREILFQTKLSPPGFLPNYTITRLDAKLTALNNTTIAFSNLNVTVPAQPSDFGDLFDTGIAINNNRYGVFHTRFGTSNSNLTSAIARFGFATRAISPPFGPELRPMISDADTIVYRNGNTITSSIVTVPANNSIIPEVVIAQSSTGFTEIGKSPSISKKDEAIDFYRNLNAAGAATLGTTAGVGIFVSLKLTSGQRKIIRMGGRLVENNPAPGGNNDGICDLGETCIPGELGFNQAGNPIFFNSFDTNSRVDVGYIESGKRGIDDDIVFVSFLGTPNIASDATGQVFSNQKGLWTISAKITADSGGGFIAEKPEKPVKVAQIGDTINSKVLTDISVYDQMANNKEKIAFYGATATGNMVIRAVVDRTPVIFVPGISGSELATPDGLSRVWFPETIADNLDSLALGNNVKVVDALRKFNFYLFVTK
jgi:hypothetical protein